MVDAKKVSIERQADENFQQPGHYQRELKMIKIASSNTPK